MAASEAATTPTESGVVRAGTVKVSCKLLEELVNLGGRNLDFSAGRIEQQVQRSGQIRLKRCGRHNCNGYATSYAGWIGNPGADPVPRHQEEIEQALRNF